MASLFVNFMFDALQNGFATKLPFVPPPVYMSKCCFHPSYSKYD